MTEELALHRSHLEQPEVLAVLGRRAQARLAARDRDRLFAVGAKDVADRYAWRHGRALLRLPLPYGFAESSDRLRQLVRATLGVREVRDGSVGMVG